MQLSDSGQTPVPFAASALFLLVLALLGGAAQAPLASPTLRAEGTESNSDTRPCAPQSRPDPAARRPDGGEPAPARLARSTHRAQPL